ncbi:MAG: cytochrome c biogenesis protein CcdA [Bdellovibrionota bacterium]
MESLFLQLKAALEAGTVASSLLALVLAYFGGILSSFTPCIYPMIPITVGFIGGTAERSVKTGWILSSFYVLGMAAVYTLLGVVASLSGKIFGTLTNSPGWYLALGLVMVASSLWMMGLIQFDPNAWASKILRSRAKHKQNTTIGIVERNEGTIFGAFILGATSAFIASPCTTPVLTTILSFIANQKSVAFGGLLMFAFALGLGTLLVFIGTFAGALKVLPKSGKWLDTVKIVSGLLILALGEYFVFKAGKLS